MFYFRHRCRKLQTLSFVAVVTYIKRISQIRLSQAFVFHPCSLTLNLKQTKTGWHFHIVVIWSTCWNVCAKVTEDEGKTFCLHMKGKIRLVVFFNKCHISAKNRLRSFRGKTHRENSGIWNTFNTLTICTFLRQISDHCLIYWVIRFVSDHVNRKISYSLSIIEKLEKQKKTLLLLIYPQFIS